ncbi:MAG: hypothetical protein ACPIOQ_11110, partial [Promethearchaeia archaeon]
MRANLHHRGVEIRAGVLPGRGAEAGANAPCLCRFVHYAARPSGTFERMKLQYPPLPAIELP